MSEIILVQTNLKVLLVDQIALNFGEFPGMFQELFFKRVRIRIHPKNFGDFPDIIIYMWRIRNCVHEKTPVYVASTYLRIAKILEFSLKYFHIFGSPSVHRIPRFNMLSLIYHMCCLYKLYIGVSRRLVINHAKLILQNETGYCPKDNPSLIYLLVLTLRWYILKRNPRYL